MTILNNHKNLLLIILSIIFLGSFLMYSASSSFAFYKYNKSDTYFLFKHIRWISIGILILLLISNINYMFFKYNATVILILSWIIMLIPILLGDDSVARWLKIGNFSLMTTSDFSKLSIDTALLLFFIVIGISNIPKTLSADANPDWICAFTLASDRIGCIIANKRIIYRIKSSGDMPCPESTAVPPYHSRITPIQTPTISFIGVIKCFNRACLKTNLKYFKFCWLFSS